MISDGDLEKSLSANYLGGFFPLKYNCSDYRKTVDVAAPSNSNSDTFTSLSSTVQQIKEIEPGREHAVNSCFWPIKLHGSYG